MSIPDRLWRVVKGQWALAEERLSELEAQTSAYNELAEAVKKAPPVQAAGSTEGPRVLPSPPAATGVGRDPLEACYALLEVEPGATLEALDVAYQARLAEVRPDQ